ncbi:MAG: hypothetical protein K2G30_03615 [Muribaculaceae bacterium]|nr:hypothetical protein [Muribaculaceae bacterium]
MRKPRHRFYLKFRHIAGFMVVLVATATASVVSLCSGRGSSAKAPEAIPSDLSHDEVLALLTPADTIRANNPFNHRLDSMPPGGRKMKINYLGATLGRFFNDSNYLHIEAARLAGIGPICGISDAWKAGEKLVPVRTCREYYLDNLTHSLPYLVPAAADLLRDIGSAFNDSLAARGGGSYRIKVTSVLRTRSLVKNLRRRNRNAVDTSAHLFATTFDISYAKFICDSLTTPRTQEDLKNLLAEVIEAQRARGRCYVKYERKQACFHITAR